MMGKKICHVSVPPLPHIRILEEGVIILQNWTICLGEDLSDILNQSCGSTNRVPLVILEVYCSQG